MKTYTLTDLQRLYLDTTPGSQYEDTPTFILWLGKLEIEELKKDIEALKKKKTPEDWLDFDPNEGDPGSEMDMLADSGGPNE